MAFVFEDKKIPVWICDTCKKECEDTFWEDGEKRRAEDRGWIFVFAPEDVRRDSGNYVAFCQECARDEVWEHSCAGHRHTYISPGPKADYAKEWGQPNDGPVEHCPTCRRLVHSLVHDAQHGVRAVSKLLMNWDGFPEVHQKQGVDACREDLDRLAELLEEHK